VTYAAMKPEVAAESLRQLVAATGLQQEPAFLEWRSRCLAVLRSAFGPAADQVREFELAVFVKNEGYTTAHGQRRDREAWRSDAANRGRGVLRASIFALETLTGDSLLDDAAIDPELWAHVQGLVAADDWAKVPAATRGYAGSNLRFDLGALVPVGLR
jgi:hypothetical protein